MSSATTTPGTDEAPSEFATWEKLARQYRLALPTRPRAGLSGELLGRGTGSSIEFQDRKDYAPGDDPRRVDWRAFARNDRLTVKLYREEVRPMVDIVVDNSASMHVAGGKRARRDGLAQFCWLLARQSHAETRLWLAGRGLARLADPRALATQAAEPINAAGALAGRPPCVRAGGLLILISDLLFPFEPAELLGHFTPCARVVLLQAIGAFEHEPQGGGYLRLEDAEDGTQHDLRLDGATVARYQARLAALRDELTRRLRTTGGALAVLPEGQPAAEAVETLIRAHVIDQ